MTLSVDLDAEVYDLAAAYAGAKGLTLSAAIGELIRRAERTPEVELERGRVEMNQHGFLEVARTGYTLTCEMVRVAGEDELV